MMLARGLLVLAIVAALWGAPPLMPAAASEVNSTQVSADSDAVAVSDALLVGLAGVTSTAIIGTLLLAAGRRRKPDRTTVSPTAAPSGGALRRRMARPGGTHAADDPIVAALGVDDEIAARRAIRRASRQVLDETERATPGPKRG